MKRWWVLQLKERPKCIVIWLMCFKIDWLIDHDLGFWEIEESFEKTLELKKWIKERMFSLLRAYNSERGPRGLIAVSSGIMLLLVPVDVNLLYIIKREKRNGTYTILVAHGLFERRKNGAYTQGEAQLKNSDRTVILKIASKFLSVLYIRGSWFIFVQGVWVLHSNRGPKIIEMKT